MSIHELKTDPQVFRDLKKGRKTFELRLNDRNYQTGDYLLLKETEHSSAEMKEGESLVFTSAYCLAQVTHILNGPIYGLQDGWCIMSIKVKK